MTKGVISAKNITGLGNGKFLKLDQTTPQTVTGGSPIFSRSWWQLALQRTDKPTLYDTQPTYNVYEYTYGSTKLYRKVPSTYTASGDIFYSEPTLENIVASRDLSL